MKWLKNEKGFTFLELTIVVAIIGFLMMIGLPNYKSAAEKAQKKTCEANRKLIESQIENYYIDEHKYPLEGEADITDLAILDNLVEEEYLKSVPQCPSNGTYDITYPKESTPLSITCDVHKDPPK